jgi:flagellar biosynthesis/type III secretory pathway protein FliH
MVEKGYFIVPADKAEAKRTQLAAIVEANEQEKQAKLAARAAEQAREHAREQAREQAMKRALEKKKRKHTSASSSWPLR